MEFSSTKALAVTGPIGLMLGVGLMLGAGGLAFADQAENDALQIKEAKIPLAQAVTIAESRIGGHASKAEFEQAAEGWIFDIEVVDGQAVSDVHVNAKTGAILSIAQDAIDDDNGEQDSAD